MKFYAPADDLETRYEIDKWCDFYTDAFRWELITLNMYHTGLC